jgi:hypothetical protein
MCTAFTLPAVPTGIKTGVAISPWSVVITPALALDPVSLDCKLNVIA